MPCAQKGLRIGQQHSQDLIYCRLVGNTIDCGLLHPCRCGHKSRRQAFWLTPLSFSPNIFANYNRVNEMVEVSWLQVSQTSQDLVHWTDVTNGSNLFATSHSSFPLNQPSHFFSARGFP